VNRIAAALFALAGAALAGCAGARPVVMHGDAGSVQIDYIGDVAATKAVAAHYCAQFDRTPSFIQADRESAYYYCLRR
jgi:hypothetical protein